MEPSKEGIGDAGGSVRPGNAEWVEIYSFSIWATCQHCWQVIELNGHWWSSSCPYPITHRAKFYLANVSVGTK